MTPTIYEWAGGREAFERWLNAFYDLVEGDERAAPRVRRARERGAPRPRHDLVVRGDGRAGRLHRPTTAATSTCWPSTAGSRSRPSSGCASSRCCHARPTTAGLPDDPEFRAALMGYAEWGTRLAVHNSQPGAEVARARAGPALGLGRRPPYVPSLRADRLAFTREAQARHAAPAPSPSRVARSPCVSAWRRGGGRPVVREFERADAHVAAAPTPAPPPTPTPDAHAAARRRPPPLPAAGPGLAVGVTEFNANLLASPRRATAAGAVGGARATRSARSSPQFFRLVIDWASVQPSAGRARRT